MLLINSNCFLSLLIINFICIYIDQLHHPVMASLPPSDCCAKVTFQEGTAKGHFETIHSLRCYVSDNYTTQEEKYLVIFTDVFGLDLLNTKLIADNFAGMLGYPVIVPDILFNDPVSANNSDFETFFANHPVEKTKKCIADFLSPFKSTFIKAKFFAGIGYCFGAKYLVHHMTESGIFNVGAIAHPSFVDEEELKQVKKPLLISAAEIDTIFTPELRAKSEMILKDLDIHYQVDLFGGVSHGFAVRGDLSVKSVRYAAEKAFADAVHWFNYHA